MDKRKDEIKGKDVVVEVKPATFTVMVNILEIVANTPLPQTRLSSKIQIPKDIVTKKVFNNTLEVEKFIQYEGIKTKVLLNVEALQTTKDISIESIEKLTNFDYVAFCAVATCYLDNVHEFSVSRIHRLITANQKARLTPSAEQNIIESIEKMRKIDVSIDYTVEANILKLTTQGGLAIIKNYMLPLKEWIYSYKGDRIIRGYKFLDTPPLVQYALVKNQVAKIPLKDLDIPNINKTEKNISLEFYLALRLIEISENPKLENRINLMRLYNAVEAKNKVEYERIRKTAEEILRYWKEIGTFGLKNFTFVKHKKGFSAIEVDLVKRGGG